MIYASFSCWLDFLDSKLPDLLETLSCKDLNIVLIWSNKQYFFYYIVLKEYLRKFGSSNVLLGLPKIYIFGEFLVLLSLYFLLKKFLEP